MSKRKLVIAAIVVAGGIAWYAFRPERLFVNKTCLLYTSPSPRD